MCKIDLPKDNICEVTLIGTGGGYGESCVIHLGEKNWVVIDSCINPITKESLPLNYLLEIGVEVKNDVKLIICSHWHDDHILGISKLLEKCESSKFAFGKATDRKKFLRLVALDYEKLKGEVSISSTIEFNQCLNIIKERALCPIQAIKDRTLFNHRNGTHNFEIISLSPSDSTLEQFDSELSTLISKYGIPDKKIILNSPNSKSVVILLRVNNHRVLLGADMEVSKNSDEGWLNILDNNISIDNKASLFKVPHHGSENAYHERIWVELLTDDVISNLTPWNRKNKLPNKDMLKKFCSNSKNVHMTSEILRGKPKKRERSIEKMIKNWEYKLKEISFDHGIIRCRIDINNSADNWQTDLFGKAIHVNPEIDKIT